MLFFLALKSLRARFFIGLLCVLSISMSLALFLLVERVRQGVEEGFTNAISDADLIVGARSGPLQLLLYSVFHLGRPTNNMSFRTYQAIKEHPVVAWTIPISLGDSYRGYSVVATDENFIKHYRFYGDQKIELAKGRWNSDIFDVVLGHSVADNLSHNLGDSVVLSHGVSQRAILSHEDSPFKVVGILRPTATPLDKSVFITLWGMQAVHVGWEKGVPDYSKTVDKSSLTKADLETESLTAAILRTKGRIALLGLQRFIAEYEAEPLSAIIPALVLGDLWRFLDQIEMAFRGVSALVVLVGFMSVLIALYMSLNERTREMAILRSQGVAPRQLTFLLLAESLFLSLFGAALGFFLQYILLLFVRPLMASSFGIYLPLTPPDYYEGLVLLAFICLGLISGLIPALKAYSRSLHQVLY